MADVTLNVIIPDEWTARVLAAFTGGAEKKLELSANNGCKIDFEYDPQQPGETAKQFGERCLRRLGRALIQLYEFKTDLDRYAVDVEAIAGPQEGVPEDILE